jgi:hypothetical protein
MWALKLGRDLAATPLNGINSHDLNKVKLSLCFNWAPRHDVLGSGGIAPLILTSELEGGEWSASRSGRFTPRERAPGTHWVGGWVGPRSVLDAVVKRKIPSPRREPNPGTPIIQPVVHLFWRYVSCMHRMWSYYYYYYYYYYYIIIIILLLFI